MKNVVGLEQEAAGQLHLLTMMDITTPGHRRRLEADRVRNLPKETGTQESVFLARMTINARPRGIYTKNAEQPQALILGDSVKELESPPFPVTRKPARSSSGIFLRGLTCELSTGPCRSSPRGQSSWSCLSSVPMAHAGWREP